MKRITATLAVAMLIISAHGQGFLNLNFESTYNLPGNPGQYGTLVSVVNALPDWTVYNGDSVLSEVYYGSNTLDYEFGGELEGGSLALSGDFSIGLYLNSSISQTAEIPVAAESLEIEAGGPGGEGSLDGSDLTVTLDGKALSFSALSEGPNYTVYGANIPANMEGQIESLIFSCQGAGSGNILLDNMEFSPTSVPEPSECALAGLGVMVFGFFRFRTEGFRRLAICRRRLFSHQA
jgi:hypothetical protein